MHAKKHSDDIPLNHHQKSCIVSIHSQGVLGEKRYIHACVRLYGFLRLYLRKNVQYELEVTPVKRLRKREAFAVLRSRLARRANVSLFMGAPLIATHVLWN